MSHEYFDDDDAPRSFPVASPEVMWKASKKAKSRPRGRPGCSCDGCVRNYSCQAKPAESAQPADDLDKHAEALARRERYLMDAVPDDFSPWGVNDVHPWQLPEDVIHAGQLRFRDWREARRDFVLARSGSAESVEAYGRMLALVSPVIPPLLSDIKPAEAQSPGKSAGLRPYPAGLAVVVCLLGFSGAWSAAELMGLGNSAGFLVAMLFGTLVSAIGSKAWKTLERKSVK